VFICICHAVTDGQVITAIDQGAMTPDSVGAATGAGTGCGSCRERIQDLIEQRCRECPAIRLQVA